MRATMIAATLACLGLAGCDNSANAPAPNAQAVAQPPCNCQQQNEAAAQAAPRRTIHRYARHRAYASHEEFEAQYSYQSQSRSTYQSESGDQEVSSGNSEGNVWVDGYGRSHYVATASAAPDDRARLAPWHGYDEDCDEHNDRR